MLTKEQMQDLLNRATAKMIEQGQACIGKHGGCEYYFMEGDKELRCAIGWLMPEDFVKQRSSSFISALVREEQVTEVGGYPVGEEDGEFLAALQRCHDIAASGMPSRFVDEFHKAACDVAGDYGLQRPRV